MRDDREPTASLGFRLMYANVRNRSDEGRGKHDQTRHITVARIPALVVNGREARVRPSLSTCAHVRQHGCEPA